MGFRLLLLKVMADAGCGANMAESGFKLDPKQPLTNSMVAKSAREKRRKIIADKKAKRYTAPESDSSVVSPIKEPMVTQIARDKRRQIVVAKKAMRCATTSNGVLSNKVKSSKGAKTRQEKSSVSSDEKLNHCSEALGQKFPTDCPLTNGKTE